MADCLSSLAVLVRPEESIDAVIRRMAQESRAVEHAGLAVVVDSEMTVQGILTDGDIRRAYARNISWSEPVSNIMIQEPVMLPVGLQPDQIILELSEQVDKAPHLKAKTIRHILLVNEDGQLVDVRDFAELLWDKEERSARVHVIGMGFVGLTLAVSLANLGHRVTGVDVDNRVINRLQSGESPIYEVGLEARLRHVVERGILNFTNSLESSRSSIYIIAVGVPLGNHGGADLSAVCTVGEQLARVLRPGDQVMLRSTVPVGTTNRVLLPILEKETELKVSEEVNLSFCPERTLAGRAFQELRTLPQLVGGVSPRCTERAARFWASLTHSVVRLSNPEVAELAKLANNSFRDVSFAFANELSLLAEEHNIDVSEVIHAANNGYPRNPIPSASPGVGGYCLPKDSFLLSESFSDKENLSRLGNVARGINKRAGQFPLRVFDWFCGRTKSSASQTTVLVIGMAFKGDPETNDIRGSNGIDIARSLSEQGARVSVWDAVVTQEQLAHEGFAYASNLAEAVLRADCIFIMNNHRANANIGILSPDHKKTLVLLFDGWKMFDREVVESIDGLIYSTLGYVTPQ